MSQSWAENILETFTGEKYSNLEAAELNVVSAELVDFVAVLQIVMEVDCRRGLTKTSTDSDSDLTYESIPLIWYRRHD